MFIYQEVALEIPYFRWHAMLDCWLCWIQHAFKARGVFLFRRRKIYIRSTTPGVNPEVYLLHDDRASLLTLPNIADVNLNYIQPSWCISSIGYWETYHTVSLLPRAFCALKSSLEDLICPVHVRQRFICITTVICTLPTFVDVSTIFILFY